MSDDTGIEWTDATWNPIRGCSRVSEGCRNCYAESVAARFSGPGLPYEGLARRTASGEARWTGKVRVVERALDQPLRWKRPRMIFVNSMSDLFHDEVSDETIAAIFGVMLLACHHTYQVLTKRPGRMRAIMRALTAEHCMDVLARCYPEIVPRPATTRAIMAALPAASPYRPGSDAPLWPPPNVWLGVSVEDQAAADTRIPLLMQTPAAVRFLSCEPLLGPVSLDSSLGGTRWMGGQRGCGERDRYGEHHHDDRCRQGIDWVIAGGESGPEARPMHPDWPRKLRDQCAVAGVAFFFKQWGEWGPPVKLHDLALGQEPGTLAAYTVVSSTDPKSIGAKAWRAFGPNGPEKLERGGKVAAGSLLDGREYKAFPREVGRG